MSESHLINAMCEGKGYAVTFEPAGAGAVICRAIKGSQQFRVLARSVGEGLKELGRLLGVNMSWQVGRP